SYRGEFEGRVQQILKECAEHPEVVLFVDELHTIVGAGHSSGGHDAAQLLQPALSSGRLRLIGATTPEEDHRHPPARPPPERRLQPIGVEELGEQETRSLLAAVAPRYERQHGVTILPEALDAAVALSVRYLPERRLPDKALELVDAACAGVVVGDRLSYADD